MLGVLHFVKDPDLSCTAGTAVPQHLPPCSTHTHSASHIVAGRQHSTLNMTRKIFLWWHRLVKLSFFDWFANMWFIHLDFSFFVSFYSSSSDTQWQVRSRQETTIRTKMVTSFITNLAEVEKGYKRSLQELDTYMLSLEKIYGVPFPPTLQSVP